MIDAFLDGANAGFAAEALSEFIAWDIFNPLLLELRRDIIDNMLLQAEPSHPSMSRGSGRCRRN
ncbi:MAG: hypothetical protein IPG56_17160 [Caulobacteraceae bacterium]|nr:hypothetical protein [Caulobacteraceae bacterium]